MKTNTENPQKKVTLYAQGQLFKIHLPVEPLRNRGGGIRSNISTFSAQSRKRMMEKLARIDFENAGFIAFVTLTYPDRNGSPAPEETDRDRDTFQKRINRRFPKASAIWRREWESRESGKFTGVLYPHYHYLFFNLPFVHHSNINLWWREVINYDGDYLRTEIKGIENWRHALYYVSKYMTKLDVLPQEHDFAPEALPAGAIRRSSKLTADGSGGEGEPLLPVGDSRVPIVSADINAMHIENDSLSLPPDGQQEEFSPCSILKLSDEKLQHDKISERLSTTTGNAVPEALSSGVEDASQCLTHINLKHPFPNQNISDKRHSKVMSTATRGSLVYVTYLTANNNNKDNEKTYPEPETKLANECDKSIPLGSESSIPAKSTGRHWGCFNSKNFPFAKSKTLRLNVGKWLEEFRNEAGKKYYPAGDTNGNGFTLFDDDAEEWISFAETLNREENA
jgi:hypothetical protein